MAEPIHIAFTGIRNPDSESFIAGTLFSQGWEISLRALDFPTLVERCQGVGDSKPILLLSTDLEGITPHGVHELRSKGFTLFLFSAHQSADEGFSDAIAAPTSALELTSLLRGSLRSPLTRSGITHRSKRAKVISIAAASHLSGTTTVTINLANELSLMGKKVLLVDADATAPAIAHLLALRGIRGSATATHINQNLWAIEFSQATCESDLVTLTEAQYSFDAIVMDLGVLSNLPRELSSRRWESEPVIWSSHSADELLILAKTDFRSLERARELLREISQSALNPKLSCLQAMRVAGKRETPADQSFLQSVTPYRPTRIAQIPYDVRSAQRAVDEQTTLYDSHEKSLLRRSIAEIAGQLVN